MAVLSDYTSGTISLANGSAIVTGTGTLFEVTRFQEGDTLQIQNLTAVIASVDSDTQLTLTEPWTGTTIVDGPYRARQLGDGTRVSTQAATVIELLGNGVLSNLAELGVEEGKTPVGGPTGEYELADLVQDPNGSLAEIAAMPSVGAKGKELLAAAEGDAARAAILTPPRPSTTGRGYFQVLHTAAGGAAQLPAGGSYAYWLFGYEASSGQIRSGFVGGIAAGGTTVASGVSGRIWSGMYWNLT